MSRNSVRLGDLGRELPAEHREDQLPVPVGGPLVVYIAVRECVAMLGAGMHLATVVDRTPGKRLTERLADRRRGV